ncbi:MAG: response regulator transcription factor [Arenicella sp.]|nr:response regulator transcription factor [Arenicella sp.]
MTDRILIVEDDRLLNEQMSQFVRDAGYMVDSCFDGETGFLEASKNIYQLILLDVMLPKRDGISLLSMLRKTSQVPIIIVTAKGAEEERITGLSRGADDYVSKPFNQKELLLRIEALLRRCQLQQTLSQLVLNIDGLEIDSQHRQLRTSSNVIELTAIQFKLFWELALHKGEVLSKAYLSQKVLNKTLGAYDRSIDMHLSRVRRKLNELEWAGASLQTVHGTGYCLS